MKIKPIAMGILVVPTLEALIALMIAGGGGGKRRKNEKHETDYGVPSSLLYKPTWCLTKG